MSVDKKVRADYRTYKLMRVYQTSEENYKERYMILEKLKESIATILNWVEINYSNYRESMTEKWTVRLT